MSNLDQATCSSFSSLELPVTHAGQVSFPADKSTADHSLPEFRQQNFNFHFGAQGGPEVFSQNSFEGQLFQGGKNDEFQFHPQADLSESNDNLEFELKDKSAPSQPLGSVMAYMQDDTSSPMCATPTASGANFAQQTFCGESAVVDLVDHLAAVKSATIADSTKQSAAASKRNADKRLGANSDAKRGAAPAAAAASGATTMTTAAAAVVDTEVFFRKFALTKRYDSVLSELKSVSLPDCVGGYVAQPKLNDTLRERLHRDTKSRQEKQLTSALLTLSFDERVSKYQAELNQLLKPVVKMLELTNEKSIDVSRMRDTLGSMVTLIASLNGTCSSDRRQCVMNHYGILGETTNNSGREKELFSDEFLTVHGFALKKDGQKKLAAMKSLRPAKRKRKAGKQTQQNVVAASKPDSEFDGSIAQIIISDNLDEITMTKGNCITRPDILVIHENEKVHLVCEEILPDVKQTTNVTNATNEPVEECLEGVLKCSFCDKEFDERTELAQHVKDSHDSDVMSQDDSTKAQQKEEKALSAPSIECVECGKQFSEQDKLQAHMFVHTGTKQFECEVCKRRCLTKAHLDQHMSSHERDGERYYCEQCDKMFAKKTNYKHHLKLHSGVKPFCCDLCHKKFATKQYLQIHHRSHSTDKPFVCDICGRGFQFNHVLVDHVRTHTGETPYVCEVCGMSFKVKRTLKRHMKTHLDERPHTCEVCNRGFKVRATLREHMKTHSNEKPYQCHLCGLAYKRNVELRKHACPSKQNHEEAPAVEEAREAVQTVPVIPIAGAAEGATLILQPMTSQSSNHFGMFISL